MSKKRPQHRPPAEQPREAPSEPAPAASQPNHPGAAARPDSGAGAGAESGDHDQTDHAASTPAGAAGQGLPEVAPLRRQVEQLEVELDQARDRALRFQAELDNYRKRAARELETERRYAALPLLRDLLSVLDNIHRAIEAGRNARAVEGLLEGFEMVAQQLEDVLRRHGCVRIEALHAPFDPNVHEAVLQQPSSEYPPNTVLQVTQTGFRLHDRVVRPSRVVVSVQSESE